MISYRNEIEALFDIFEKELHFTENQIFEKCNSLIKEHKFDRDYMFDLNDTLNSRGYSFQYDVPPLKNKDFNNEEYCSLIENVTKSKDKTEKFIQYLNDVNDFRLSFCSLHALKTKFLVELNILPKNNKYINENLNSNLRDLFFNSYFKNEYNIILPCLEKVGISYPTLNYMIFRIDMEFLLWSLEQNDKSKGYIKTNTIKIAFNIAPKNYFIRNDKSFYDEQFANKLNSFLKLINKDYLDFVKYQWDKRIDQIDDTGYKLFYKIL